MVVSMLKTVRKNYSACVGLTVFVIACINCVNSVCLVLGVELLL